MIGVRVQVMAESSFLYKKTGTIKDIWIQGNAIYTMIAMDEDGAILGFQALELGPIEG